MQEETYPLTGTLYCTAYNDTFGPDGQPLLLWEDRVVEMSALADAPLSLPRPQQPETGGYTFLGWVGRYDTAGGRVYRLMPDPLTAEDAAVIRPYEAASAVWCSAPLGRETVRAATRGGWCWTTAQTPQSTTPPVPMASGGMVYLCAYPAPQQAGRRFAGWYDADGAPVETLPATAFFGERNGETDWSSPRTVTLYAHWETA